MVDGHLRDPTAWLGAQNRKVKLPSKAGLEPRWEGDRRAKQRERDSLTLTLVTSQGIFPQPERGFYSQEKSKPFSKWMESSLLCSTHSAKRRAALININEPKLTSLGVSFQKYLLFLSFCPCDNLFLCPTILALLPTLPGAIISASEERLGLGWTEAKRMIFLEMIFSL